MAKAVFQAFFFQSEQNPDVTLLVLPFSGSFAWSGGPVNVRPHAMLVLLPGTALVLAAQSHGQPRKPTSQFSPHFVRDL